MLGGEAIERHVSSIVNDIGLHSPWHPLWWSIAHVAVSDVTGLHITKPLRITCNPRQNMEREAMREHLKCDITARLSMDLNDKCARTKGDQ